MLKNFLRTYFLHFWKSPNKNKKFSIFFFWGGAIRKKYGLEKWHLKAKFFLQTTNYPKILVLKHLHSNVNGKRLFCNSAKLCNFCNINHKGMKIVLWLYFVYICYAVKNLNNHIIITIQNKKLFLEHLRGDLVQSKSVVFDQE